VTTGRAALAGAASGAWFGLLYPVHTGRASLPMVAAIMIFIDGSSIAFKGVRRCSGV
jgi:hypothetical protein